MVPSENNVICCHDKYSSPLIDASKPCNELTISGSINRNIPIIKIRITKPIFLSKGAILFWMSFAFSSSGK